MSLKVIKGGLLASLQDLGRFGFQKHGVVVGGAMDPLSLRLSNLLVSNQEGDAAIEITMTGTSLQFEKEALIAITGGNLSPQINGKTVPMWRPVMVKEGALLEFKSCQSGCRAYLAIAGGFRISKVMNSKSTYLRGAIGGYKGRALRAGDRLIFEHSLACPPLSNHTDTFPFAAAGWRIAAAPFTNGDHVAIVRVMKGPEFDQFSDNSRKQFFNKEFVVTPQSDRMGYRLAGPTLALDEPFDMLSESVTNGTIQVPENGQPIMLLADRQTTGGYPRIAQIASIDLPVVAQLIPGKRLRFQEITLKEAEQLYIKRENEIRQLQIGLALKLHRGEDK
ncbi:biotin-dependent carboxyltransferase family protein [Bacillus sp. PK3_68]|uniref:5-oxoprolinase subunit C family protein n=1 Tax=Bacillus sp. PK3_68 TaxID=2027408 RepID=UPI000E7172D5|nr:biotin-dependent carboxyltransferase family protein [Bacillus sp. PK3_68]RJS61881.1 KipI antagonist [Bacillus sp. PK3_68]